MNNTTKLLIYRCYPTDACDDCRQYNNLLFHQESAPKLPRHENCRCYYEPLSYKYAFNLNFLDILQRNQSHIHSSQIKPSPPPHSSPTLLPIPEPEIPSSLSYISSVNELYSIISESNNLVHVSDDMVSLLKKYETPYSKYLIKDNNGNILGIKPHDVGDGGITVGFGHFISNNTMKNNMSEYQLTQKNLSIMEATNLLRKDLEYFEKQVLNLIKKMTFISYNTNLTL